MQTLEVRLLGGVHVRLEGQALAPFPTRWSAGLFAYLAANLGRRIPRNVLATLFWPEETDQQARKALRNALWRIRSHLSRPGLSADSLISISSRDAGLDEGRAWVDVSEFTRRLPTSRRSPLTPEHLEQVVDLYQGHFLEGFDFEWSMLERERLRLSFLASLELLLKHHMENGEWRMALQRGQALLLHDPLREHVHRCLMLCHSFMGNRPLAVRQYRECARILEEELGIAPMESTRDLLRRIQDEVPLRSDSAEPMALFVTSPQPPATLGPKL